MVQFATGTIKVYDMYLVSVVAEVLPLLNVKILLLYYRRRKCRYNFC